MASGVVSKVDSRHSWSGGKWQKRREKKGGRGGSSLDSSEFGFGLLGVMVRVAQFVSEGCRVGLRGVSAMLLFDVGI